MYLARSIVAVPLNHIPLVCHIDHCSGGEVSINAQVLTDTKMFFHLTHQNVPALSRLTHTTIHMSSQSILFPSLTTEDSRIALMQLKETLETTLSRRNIRDLSVFNPLPEGEGSMSSDDSDGELCLMLDEDLERPEPQDDSPYLQALLVDERERPLRASAQAILHKRKAFRARTSPQMPRDIVTLGHATYRLAIIWFPLIVPPSKRTLKNAVMAVACKYGTAFHLGKGHCLTSLHTLCSPDTGLPGNRICRKIWLLRGRGLLTAECHDKSVQVEPRAYPREARQEIVRRFGNTYQSGIDSPPEEFECEGTTYDLLVVSPEEQSQSIFKKSEFAKMKSARVIIRSPTQLKTGDRLTMVGINARPSPTDMDYRYPALKKDVLQMYDLIESLAPLEISYTSGPIKGFQDGRSCIIASIGTWTVSSGSLVATGEPNDRGTMRVVGLHQGYTGTTTESEGQILRKYTTTDGGMYISFEDCKAKEFLLDVAKNFLTGSIQREMEAALT